MYSTKMQGGGQCVPHPELLCFLFFSEAIRIIAALEIMTDEAIIIGYTGSPVLTGSSSGITELSGSGVGSSLDTVEGCSIRAITCVLPP